MFKIAVLQHAMAAEIDANLKTAERLMRDAAEAGARLVVFPELQLSPFFPKRRALAKDDPSAAYLMDRSHPALKRLSELARAYKLVTVANLYMSRNGRRFDASPVIDSDGTVLGVSEMVHVAQFDGFWEKDYYDHGEGFEVYDTALGRIGVVICYDRHFPESWRACALKGAEIIAIPACNLAHENLDLFAQEVGVMAMQNSVYAAMANRCGDEDGQAYAGQSVIAGPDGALLARAGSDEQVLVAECDPRHRLKTARKAGWLAELQDWLKPGAEGPVLVS